MTVSAVIPCFRCVETVRRAALSVAAQTRRPVQLILVDDGSGDDTIRVLYAMRDELGPGWVKVIELGTNHGPAVARNAGWEQATAEFVAFLDSDDYWLPEKLERQVAFMHAHPEFGITGHLAHYGAAENLASRRQTSSIPFTEISRLRVLLKNPMVTPSFMVRRDCSPRFDPSARHMEDHRFLQEAVLRGTRVARIEETLAVIPKAAFGVSGLSGQLLDMERAELSNYRALHRMRAIGPLSLILLWAWSLLKFARRLAIVALRRSA